MFGIILQTASALMHLYVFWRASKIPALTRLVSRRGLGVATFGLWSSVLLARYLRHEVSGPLAAALELFGMTWLATVFLLFVSLLAVDLLTGYGRLLPRLAPHLRGTALVGAALMAVIGIVQATRAPAVVEHEVALPGLPRELDSTVLVALSDLHLGTQRGAEWLAARAEQVKALQPDLIVLLGDNFDGRRIPDADALRPVLRSLSAPLGTWAVLGNHDLHDEQAPGVALLESAGIGVLRDRWTEPRPGLVLVGVDDLTRRSRKRKIAGTIAEAMSGRPAGATILLSHSPLQAEEAAREGAGLMLCGHTHGGQIWPFGLLVKLRYPLVAGRYDVGKMAAIVSRGTGFWGPHMRLWHRSEILKITLRSSQATPASPR
ncbi:MAG: metallophosphoesterase [Myxococcales bacterium]|jgi:predicted MPP superfamily phosphohydrolase